MADSDSGTDSNYMDGPRTSYRRILRATAIVSSGSVLNIAIGVVRTKALALLLGADGVGLSGILDSIVRTAATFFGMGMSTSGVRQISLASSDAKLQSIIQRGFLAANFVLGLSGAIVIWTTRSSIAKAFLGNGDKASTVGWLALIVFLSVLATSQTSLLQALRRIGDATKTSIAGAFTGCVAGVIAIFSRGQDGIIIFLMAAPATSLICGIYYLSKLPASKIKSPIRSILPHLRGLLGVGAVFMLASFLSEATLLSVRAVLDAKLSISSVGQFQACWTISTQYIGFVLTAMIADFYPNLASVATDKNASNKIVNKQVYVSLLLGGPIVLIMLALAPWILDLLYTSSFRMSAEILRWQVFGDILKIAGWPLGFILISRAEIGWFVVTQSFWNLSYFALVWFGLPYFGLKITGIAFLFCYLLGFLINNAVCKHVTNFKYDRKNYELLAILLFAATSIFLISSSEWSYSFLPSTAIAAAFGVYALFTLLSIAGFSDSSTMFSRALSFLRLRK